MADELRLCRRYFQVIEWGFIGPSTNSCGAGASMTFPVPMRANPTYAQIASLTATAFPTSAANIIAASQFGISSYKVATATDANGGWTERGSVSARL
jgi:hypothetical protein